MKWLADENFPFPAFRILELKGFDIKHIGLENPSVEDVSVIQIALAENRIILTFDSDFGELVFRHGYAPPGVIYFRLTSYQLSDPSTILVHLLEEDYSFENYFTVIGHDTIRQRTIAL